MNASFFAVLRSRLALLLLFLLPATASADGLLVSTVLVRDAAGAPVAGATVCLGTANNLSAFGGGTTDGGGQAFITAALPTPPATLYVTAHADGHGVQLVQQLSGTVPPPSFFAQLELPAAPGGPTCSGSGLVPPNLGAIEVDSAELLAAQVFQIRLFLDNPPVGPYPVTLASSDPRLVSVPREVTFPRGQRMVVVEGRVSPDVRRPAAVTLRAYTDRRKPVEMRVQVQPAPGDRRRGKQR